MAEKQKGRKKTLVGKITHFYDRIKVAVVELNASLKRGDRIEIIRPVRILEQEAQSMQIEKKSIERARKGQSIGLKVNAEVRKGDLVYKIA